MKLEAISDTHNKHEELKIKGADILVCAGDFSFKGTEEEAKNFLEWFKNQNHKHKILVPGNHDLYVEREGNAWVNDFCDENNIHLLINDFTIIDGIKFWGTPITPRFSYGWAWNRDRSKKKAEDRFRRGVLDAGFIGDYWEMIPTDTDVIVSHGPCRGILDKTRQGTNQGCDLLKEKVFQIKPKLFISGHIHEDRGIESHEGIQFANVASCCRDYKIQETMIFDIN